jgi:hypothetical protein
MDQLEIIMDKEKVDYSLFQLQNYSIADIELSVNQSAAFVAVNGGEVTAQCLVQDKKFYMDITHFAYNNPDDAFSLLQHVIANYKESTCKYVEAGCGNANLDQYALMQRVGFRVIGVVANYYLSDTKTVNVENAIANLDMIRFRFSLTEKGFTTTGSNMSGVKLQ